MPRQARSYYKPAKILLFGEYALLNGGEGLAIPYPHYRAVWQYARNNIKQAPHILSLQRILAQWHDYIKQYQHSQSLPFEFDHESFESDLKHGLYIMSDIPQGYGLGSSGAITALLYERYVRNALQINAHSDLIMPDEAAKNLDLLAILRQHLALLEAFFHGSSSGIDPLVSYTQQALLVRDNQVQLLSNLPTLRAIEPNDAATSSPIDSTSSQPYYIFLYNTGIARQTAPLVQQFKHKMAQEPAFAQMCQQTLTALNSQCIEAYSNKQYPDLLTAWQSLSALQLTHFAHLIPTNALLQSWQRGIDKQYFWLKLCGAGGGGFLLGITQQYALLNQYFEESKLSIYQIWTT